MRTDEVNIRDPYLLIVDGAYYVYGNRSEPCWGKADGFAGLQKERKASMCGSQINRKDLLLRTAGD